MVRHAGLVLRDLLRDVGVQGSLVGCSPVSDKLHRARVDSPDRVDRRSNPVRVANREPAYPVGPRARSPITESSLGSDRFAISVSPEASIEIQRVEQCDADADVVSRGKKSQTHLVGVGVLAAAKLVVQVVELANAAHTGQRHLGEHRSGQPTVGVRLKPFGGAVHQVTPRPEGPAAGLGA